MGNQYFVHEIRTGNSTFKGIVICNTFDAAKQTYHAFLGAYGYGHDADTSFCQGMITDMNGTIHFSETWLGQIEEPVGE